MSVAVTVKTPPQGWLLSCDYEMFYISFMYFHVPMIFLKPMMDHLGCAGAAFGENVILMSGGQDTTVQAKGRAMGGVAV